ncbi:MAG: response regulator [Myxococcales bacterium]|nr:response regulator [Myxococcales bacterium]
MALVLVVDDEAVLRNSMARGIGRLEGVEAVEAADFGAALRMLDERPPDLIVSDIDLPDRMGIELLGELGKRALSLPVIFVSAYLRAFRAQIPPRANIEALEKPVPLEELRKLVVKHLEQRVGASTPAPFGVADYVQLACMGRHSVRIESDFGDGRKGVVTVHEGEIWSASHGALRGAAAFMELAFAPDARVACSRLMTGAGPREIEESADFLLMEAARCHDEHTSRGPEMSAELIFVEDDTEAEETEDGTEDFEQHWEAGIDALLAKDYQGAFASFLAAQALRPEDAKVHANLERLRSMGIEAVTPAITREGGTA